LLLRLVLSPYGGLNYDLGRLRHYGRLLLERPLWEFYESGHDHLPGDLWVIWLLFKTAQVVSPGTAVNDLPITVVKLVAVLGDLLAGAALFLAGRAVGGVRSGLLAAALFTFNPAPVFLSAIWGQWDSLSAAFALVGCWLVVRGSPEWAFAPLLYGVLIKPQIGLLGPLFLVAFVRRYVWPWQGAAGGGEQAWRIRQAVRPVMAALVSSVGVFLAALLPFGVGVPPLPTRYVLFERVGDAADTYQSVSALALNLWWLLGPFPANLVPDSTPFLFGVSYLIWGAALLGAVTAFVLVVAWRQASGRMVIWGCLVLTLATFVLATRMHERYLWPAVGFGALAAALAPALRPWYAALSLSYFGNLYWIYDHNEVALEITDYFSYYVGPLLAVLNVVLLLQLLVLGRGALARDAEPADDGRSRAIPGSL
jgi:dolichyl-phosphate-mannose-protein mannosyltransferase